MLPGSFLDLVQMWPACSQWGTTARHSRLREDVEDSGAQSEEHSRLEPEWYQRHHSYPQHNLWTSVAKGPNSGGENSQANNSCWTWHQKNLHFWRIYMRLQVKNSTQRDVILSGGKAKSTTVAEPDTRNFLKLRQIHLRLSLINK